MDTNPSRSRSLYLLGFTFLIPLPFCFAAFLVNVEVALQLFFPTLHLFDLVFPGGLYLFLKTLSADLSTVSTLIPVMILAIPLGQIIRILRHRKSDPTFAQRLGPDPYPSHFGFFQVMLGLTGTLYGMYIGLDVSGVSELAGQSPTADSIRQSLDRLLGGTATALLSSLVGLIGAFITARPVPWLFAHIAGVKADETRQTLTATIERLTADLRGLSQASRTFTDFLNPDTAKTVLERMDRQESATREACGQLEAMGQLIQSSSTQTQDTLATMVQHQWLATERLARLESMDQTVRAIIPILQASEQQFSLLLETQRQSNELIRRLTEGQETRHQHELKLLSEMAAATQAQRDQLQRGHDSLKSALAVYLNPPPR